MYFQRKVALVLLHRSQSFETILNSVNFFVGSIQCIDNIEASCSTTLVHCCIPAYGCVRECVCVCAFASLCEIAESI